MGDKKEPSTISLVKGISLPDRKSLEKLEIQFFERVKIIQGISATLDDLTRRGVLSILFTSAPVEMVEWFLARFPFDHGIGGLSLLWPGNGGAEDLGGKTRTHSGDRIREFLFNRQLENAQCLAVTVSASERFLQGLFERYLVLVYSKEVFGKAGRHLYADNLAEVLKFV